MSTGSILLFDPAQVRRQSRGDSALEVEILALFSVELERLMRQLDQAHDDQTRAERLRAIIRLARNTGAARLLHEARLIEPRVAAGEADLQPLRDAVAQTLAHVHCAAADAGQACGGAS